MYQITRYTILSNALSPHLKLSQVLADIYNMKSIGRILILILESKYKSVFATFYYLPYLCRRIHYIMLDFPADSSMDVTDSYSFYTQNYFQID